MWTAPLVDALAARRDLPFVRRERGLTVLFLARERPYVIDGYANDRDARIALLASDRVDEALVCLSGPVGIESLPRVESRPLLDAYHAGALALGAAFGVWGAIALDRPEPDDVDQVIDAGCVGVSMPAGALAGADDVARLGGVLARLEAREAPLFVHPGPGPDRSARHMSLREPLWWPALTEYVFQLQTAWLAFIHAARPEHPRLRVIFAALAGLAPLHAERLASRGGPGGSLRDELVFYDTSSYGPSAARALAAVVGSGQIVYGSDRPVVDSPGRGVARTLGWELLADNAHRALTGSGAAALDLVSGTA
jgi:hypothetical protein